ncbi:MAG: hypothetical protein VKL20_01005 [Synechocystis sp.]|nr:hypothetical protein [Synechocystis sp.]
MRDFFPSPIAQSTSMPGVPLDKTVSGVTNEHEAPFLSSGFALTIVLLLVSILTGWQWFRSQKKIKQLQQETTKQADDLNQTLITLQEHFNSPDLKGAKILALDYLRMRLDEEVFRYQIIHQVQEQLTALISQLVKSTFPEPPNPKQILVDRLIEIEYDLEGLEGKWYRCTVLRIHVQLRKLPLQSSSNTIKQMVEAVTLFLNNPQGQSEWKTPLQEQWLALRWESSNQPLPLLNLQNYPTQQKDPSDSQRNGTIRTKAAGNPSPISPTGVFARPTP